MTFSENEFGYSLQNNQFHVFFGNRIFDISQAPKLFPNYTFLKIKQTHSDIVINNTTFSSLTEADAHYTEEKNSALLISTADCLPIMIYCQQTKRVAAIHAGWKGVANQILSKTLKKLIETGSSKKNFDIYVGPHLVQSSFEVDEDVFLELKRSQYQLKESDYSFFKNEKFYVDLEKIIATQIYEATKIKFELTSLSLDTKTNKKFHSFRRDKALAGRNLSFICLL